METEFDYDDKILDAVRRAIDDTLAHDQEKGMPYLQNRRVFRLCRYLRTAVDPQRPSHELRPYLRLWYDACAEVLADDENHNGEKLDLTFDDACAQLAYLWDGNRVQHGIVDFWGLIAAMPEADVAKAYDAPHVRKLVSALYHASRRTQDGTFHLSQADAGRIMGKSQPAGRYAIALLIADGLIEQVSKGHTGKNPTYKWRKA